MRNFPCSTLNVRMVPPQCICKTSCPMSGSLDGVCKNGSKSFASDFLPDKGPCIS